MSNPPRRRKNATKPSKKRRPSKKRQPSKRRRSHDIKSKSKLPTRHSNRISQSRIARGLLAILHSTLAIIMMFLRLLKIPAAIFLVILVMLYFWKYVLAPRICQVPGSAYVVPMCKHTIAIEDPYFETVIRQDRELAKMQKMMSDNAALPYLLLTGHWDMKGLVFALSALDASTKTRLMPLVQGYGILVQEVIDGIQDCLASTDGLVDNVILTNKWTESRLQAINDRDTSITAPITKLRDMIMDLSIHSERIRTEAQLRSAFYYHTGKLQNQTGVTLLEYQKIRTKMTSLRTALGEMAAAFTEEGNQLTLDKEKLGQSSYWKWILRSHQHKIANFDQKMLLLAEFYNHSLEGEKVVTVTILKLEEMRGRIDRLKDELETVSLQPTQDPEAFVSLQLSIDRLKASIKYLESAKRKSHKQREQRMAEFENKFAKAMM